MLSSGALPMPGGSACTRKGKPVGAGFIREVGYSQSLSRTLSALLS